MECLPDGHFKHYVCDHDLLSDSRIACYCLGPDGPLVGTEATDPENLDCSGIIFFYFAMDFAQHLLFVLFTINFNNDLLLLRATVIISPAYG